MSKLRWYVYDASTGDWVLSAASKYTAAWHAAYLNRLGEGPFEVLSAPPKGKSLEEWRLEELERLLEGYEE